jgi:serine protease
MSMFRLDRRVGAIAILVIATSVAFGRGTNTQPAPVVPGAVYVKLVPEGARLYASGTPLAALCAPGTLPASLREQIAFVGHDMARYASPAEALSVRIAQDDDEISRILVVRFNKDSDPRAVSAAFARSPFVQYCEPLLVRKVALAVNDPLVGQQWHIAKIEAPKAWDIEEGDSNVVVAVVDNGVNYTHPDLAANIWYNKGEMGFDSKGRDKRTNGVDDDGDGYIDDFQGWDFAGASTGAPQDNDPSGGNHGIHVAGIIGAVTNNNIGVAGIAHHCRIMVVKTAYDNDPGSLPFGFQGIAFAGDHGAKIINCSWGGSTSSSTEQEVINYVTKKGSLVVCAAGNNVSDEPFFPSWYDHVMSVAGSNGSDIGDGFYSNYGPRIDVIAPGTNIMSTYNGDSYVEETGTSMASPCAAGVAALVASHFPTYTPEQVAARVRITGDDIDSNMYYSYQKKFGRTRVNAYHAVNDADVKSVVVDTLYITDDSNGNGQLEPGETGAIRIRFKNVLAPTAALTTRLSDTVYGPQPYVDIIAPNAFVGALGTFGTAVTASNTFLVHVAPNCPQNYKLWFRVDFTDGNYHDYRQFYLYLNPTFITMDANDISCTLNSRGNQAYNDFPKNHQGVGMTYKGGENLLFEGGLILATDSVHVVDVVRGSDPQGGQDSDFVLDQRLAFITSPLGTLAQETAGRFTDAGASLASRIGVKVDQHNYEFTSTGNRNYIIVSYKVSNTGTKTIKGLFAGLYMDWDIGASGDSNEVRWDAGGRLSWIQRVNAPQYPLCGSAVLSSQNATYEALDNNNTNAPPIAVNDGFLPEEKYQAIAGLQHRATSSIADVSNTVGAGPVDIPVGGSETFAFALLAAPDMTGLRTATANARQLWGQIVAGTSNRPSIFFPNISSVASLDTTVLGIAKNKGVSATDAQLSLVGSGAADFALVTTSPLHLEAGASGNVALRFTPSGSGTKFCTMLINYGSTTDTVNVFASAALPTVSFPTVFESQRVDSVIANVFANHTGAALTAHAAITGLEAAEFSISPDSTLVNPGQRMSATISFVPQTEGDKSAILVVTSGTRQDTFYLMGSAQSYGISTFPDSLVFDSTEIGYESTRSVSIINTRNDTVTVTYDFHGADSAAFRVPASTAPNPLTLPPGGVTFNIYFGPKHSGVNVGQMAVHPPIGRTINVGLSGKGGPQNGVEDGIVPTAGGLSVVPNPVRSAATVTWSGKTALRTIAVWDLVGRQIATIAADAHGAFQLDASTLPAGTYLLRTPLGVEQRFVVTK